MSSHSSTFTFIHKAMIVMMAQGKSYAFLNEILRSSAFDMSMHHRLPSYYVHTHKNAPVCLLYYVWMPKVCPKPFFSLPPDSAYQLSSPHWTTVFYDVPIRRWLFHHLLLHTSPCNNSAFIFGRLLVWIGSLEYFGRSKGVSTSKSSRNREIFDSLKRVIWGPEDIKYAWSHMHTPTTSILWWHSHLQQCRSMHGGYGYIILIEVILGVWDDRKELTQAKRVVKILWLAHLIYRQVF